VPPIALWRISAVSRQALLSGDILYFCATTRDAWQRAMTHYSIDVRKHNHGWHLERDGRSASVNRVEAAKLRYGIAFGGMLPSDVAATLARQL
jgi:hypothetical protein